MSDVDSILFGRGVFKRPAGPSIEQLLRADCAVAVRPPSSVDYLTVLNCRRWLGEMRLTTDFEQPRVAILFDRWQIAQANRTLINIPRIGDLVELEQQLSHRVPVYAYAGEIRHGRAARSCSVCLGELLGAAASAAVI